MKPEIPGVNAEKGLDLYDDDLEVYLSVLRSYAINTPEVLEKLREVSAETLAGYAAVIHGIKGTSITIGAEETAKAAKELELMAKAGDLPGLLAKNDIFLKQAGDLVNNIKCWLEKLDAKNL